VKILVDVEGIVGGVPCAILGPFVYGFLSSSPSGFITS
jgi:hypothetical protein